MRPEMAWRIARVLCPGLRSRIHTTGMNNVPWRDSEVAVSVLSAQPIPCIQNEEAKQRLGLMHGPIFFFWIGPCSDAAHGM